MVRQDGKAVVCKRRSQDVAQEASTSFVVDGTGAGFRMQVETAILHHQVADDLECATRGKRHGLAFALGWARWRQTGNRCGRQLREDRVAVCQLVVYLQGLGTDPHHAPARECLEYARLRDLNDVGHGR